jgi:pyruvate/2-oxoglutarate/acetoin dehydrogenase E1 component
MARHEKDYLVYYRTMVTIRHFETLAAELFAEGDVRTPLGQAVVKRKGQDVTLVCYGAGFYLCQEAATALGSADIEAEIVDLRSLKPLDMTMLAASIRKTGLTVIVHEACLTGGLEQSWPLAFRTSFSTTLKLRSSEWPPKMCPSLSHHLSKPMCFSKFSTWLKPSELSYIDKHAGNTDNCSG